MVDFAAITQEHRAYFTAGRTRDISTRVQCLEKLRKWIHRHDKDILAALRTDLNKPPFESYATEVGAVLDELRYTLNHIHRWHHPQFVPTNLKNFPSFGRKYPEPYGLALIMSPWNYPFMLTTGPLIAAVAAGNCAIVKPSAYSPETSSLLARMCAEVFNKGHVTVVEGGRRENAALLNERYDIILFTGSTSVGRTVMQAASRYLTPVILELGGKSPCIVDETANLQLAAKRIVWGKCINAGQTCVAPDYVLAHASIKDDLLSEMAASIETHYSKTPCNNPDYPRIINEKHFHRLLGLLEGEHTIIGGSANPATLQIEPTILDNTSWDAPVMQEEIFGPLLPVLTYTTPEEAVAMINARPKPLAMYLFTTGKEAQKYFLRQISFGGGCVNDTLLHLATPRLPFGGVGDSGMGCYHGKAGFDAFSHIKSVLHMSKGIDLPLRYPPYSELKLKLLKRL